MNFFSLFWILLFCIFCWSPSSTHAQQSTKGPLIVGKYKISAMLQKQKMRKKALENSFIELKKAEDFRAFVGCNQIGGHWTLKNRQLTIHDLVRTEMYCEQFMTDEDLLLHLLSKVNTWKWVSGKLILCQGKKALITLIQDE
jgi:heat shock protein HslJ